VSRLLVERAVFAPHVPGSAEVWFEEKQGVCISLWRRHCWSLMVTYYGGKIYRNLLEDDFIL